MFAARDVELVAEFATGSKLGVRFGARAAVPASCESGSPEIAAQAGCMRGFGRHLAGRKGLCPS